MKILSKFFIKILVLKWQIWTIVEKIVNFLSKNKKKTILIKKTLIKRNRILIYILVVKFFIQNT